MLRFGKKGKLSPRYMGPYEIVERIGEVAYRLRLPLELARIHDVFHISMLRKCKTRENSNFLKNGKMVILVKIQNFSRSWMTKRTSPLESSREI